MAFNEPQAEKAKRSAIANVPAGPYPIQFWHERYGPSTQAVRVRAGATTTVDFT
jgi:hypothetical protein